MERLLLNEDNKCIECGKVDDQAVEYNDTAFRLCRECVIKSAQILNIPLQQTSSLEVSSMEMLFESPIGVVHCNDFQTLYKVIEFYNAHKHQTDVCERFDKWLDNIGINRIK